MESREWRIDMLVGESNWRNWKFMVADLLALKRVYDVVQGRRKAPVEPEPIVEDATAAQRTDHAKQMAKFSKEISDYEYDCAQERTVIRMNISNEVRNRIANTNEPSEMWAKLCDIYEKKSINRVYSLLSQVMDAKKDPSVDMASHLAAMRVAWSDLQAASQQEDKAVFPESLLIVCIFKSLSQESYVEFYSVWDSMPKAERTIDRLEDMLVRRASFSTKEVVAETTIVDEIGLIATNPGGRRGGRQDQQRNDRGSVSEGATNNNKNNAMRRVIVCYCCSKLGHIARDCPVRLAKESAQYAGVVESECGLMCSAGGIAEKSAWHFDSGATRH